MKRRSHRSFVTLYTRFVEWNLPYSLLTILSIRNFSGGARKARVEISGQGVYRQLKHEGGVHRVQRVPKTERAGRIHTSTITVSVMPLPKEVGVGLGSYGK